MVAVTKIVIFHRLSKHLQKIITNKTFHFHYIANKSHPSNPQVPGDSRVPPQAIIIVKFVEFH